jgi:alkylation response protein AidB-like acyl-CoA dehydrogenase
LAEHTRENNIAFGPMAKLFVTESMATDAADIVALAAPRSLLWRDGNLGMIELTARRALGMTIYGGTSEIQRSLIAEHFLHMPRTRGAAS